MGETHLPEEENAELPERGLGVTAETLHDCIRRDMPDCVGSALRAGLSPDSPVGEKRFTPLMTAVREGKADIVRQLIEAGASVDLKDADGTTALLHAASLGEDPSLQLLLQAATTLEARDASGQTALIRAAGGGWPSVTRILIEAGADTNLRDNRGETALILATKGGYLEVVTLLLEAGADRSMKNSDGLTAADLAQAAHQPELLKRLRKAEKEVPGNGPSPRKKNFRNSMQNKPSKGKRTLAPVSSLVVAALAIAIMALVFIGVQLWVRNGWSFLRAEQVVRPGASPEEAARATLLSGIDKVEAFRAKSGLLPTTLAEAGVNSAGSWIYSPLADLNEYSIEVTVAGATSTYDSKHGLPGAAIR